MSSQWFVAALGLGQARSPLRGSVPPSVRQNFQEGERLNAGSATYPCPSHLVFWPGVLQCKGSTSWTHPQGGLRVLRPQSVRTGWGSLCPSPARGLPVGLAPFLSFLPDSTHPVHCPSPHLVFALLLLPATIFNPAPPLLPDPVTSPLLALSCCPLPCPLPQGSRPGAARSSTAESSSSRSEPCRGCMWLTCARSRCWPLYGRGYLSLCWKEMPTEGRLLLGPNPCYLWSSVYPARQWDEHCRLVV